MPYWVVWEILKLENQNNGKMSTQLTKSDQQISVCTMGGNGPQTMVKLL